MESHHAAIGHPPTETPAVAGPALAVYVLATTNVGTRAALIAAGTFAWNLRARIVLLVPHVVPYALQLDHPADPVAFAGERYRDAAAALNMDVTIRVCACRSADVVATLLPQDAVVLIGGATIPAWLGRLGWKTREQRLARRIECGGRRVLFVDCRG